MRAALSELEVIRPRTVAHALSALAAEAAAGAPRPTPLAGGTDLFVYLNAGALESRRFLDLWPLDELRGIDARRDRIRFGALATFAEIRAHPAVRRALPSLAAAAAEVGAMQIQHRATIAGNVANGSPAGDSLPVLLAHDAVVIARSVRGERAIPFARFYRGYRALALEPEELIVAIEVPVPAAGTFAFFRKVGTRRAQSISKVVLAGTIVPGRGGRVGEARLAWGSVAPTPVLAPRAQAALAGAKPAREVAARARDELARDIAPIDDIRSDREYRMEVAGNLLEQMLRAYDPKFAK